MECKFNTMLLALSLYELDRFSYETSLQSYKITILTTF